MSDIIRGAEGEPPKPRTPPPPSAGIAIRALATQSSGATTATAPRPESAAIPDWYGMAEAELQRLERTIRRGLPFVLDDIVAIATGLVDTLSRDDRILARAISGHRGAAVILNMVNVGVLAPRLGVGLGYGREELIRLTTAALVHDIGMFSLPEEIVSKPDKLSTHDRASIRQHPALGAKLISKLGPEWEWLAQVVMQEHERWGGQGYPRGLKENQIHEYARVIGIVDIFEALLNARPYRARLLPHEAVRELLVAEKNSFSNQIFKALIHEFSIYPLGTRVRLNTGDRALVTQLNSRFPLRPVVAVEPEDDRFDGAPAKVIDLSRTTLVHIVEVLQPQEPADAPTH
ncbi:MAG TPA: HD domain-containing phosphohydrolase [Nitrospirales bacterium]|nr:HD domain-containing phosphohydrolase [Nitrospirales bacterium]